MPFEMTKPLDEIKAETVLRINARAGETITERLPLWRQTNLSARATMLQAIGQAHWSDGEANEWRSIQAEWDWIASIRDRANAATKAVMAAHNPAQVRIAERIF